MTRIVVKSLIFDKRNIEHIKKHNVTQEEVELAGKHFVYHKQAHSGSLC